MIELPNDESQLQPPDHRLSHARGPRGRDGGRQAQLHGGGLVLQGQLQPPHDDDRPRQETVTPAKASERTAPSVSTSPAKT